MQIHHTAGGPGQSGGRRVTLFCVTGAEGTAAGASRYALSHISAAVAAASAVRLGRF